MTTQQNDTSFSESATLTFRLPSDLKDRLGVLAEKTQRSRSFLASEAVSDYVERELAIIEGIQRGLDDVKAGRVIPHKEAMRRLHRSIDKASKERA